MILCSPCNVKGSVTGWKFLDDFSFAMKIQEQMCRQGQPWFQQPKQDQNELGIKTTVDFSVVCGPHDHSLF